MNLTRKSFIGLALFSTLSLSACNYKRRPKNEWVPTGVRKEFEPGEHLITNMVDLNYDEPDQIEIPEGYSVVDMQEVVDSFGGFGVHTETVGTLYSFMNDVKVEAEEYIYYDNYGNEEKREYPFAGRVIDKVLVKEVK